MKKSFILLLAMALFSCKHEETRHAVETVQTKTELKENASNLFEQIKVFPLETTDSSLVT
jgi:hypothetical protein